MSKSSSALKLELAGSKQVSALYSLSKDSEGVYQLKWDGKFQQSAMKAMDNLDAVMVDIKPIAVNLYTVYRKVVVKDALMGRLQFYRTIDQRVPVKSPKPGTAERKEFDRNPWMNRLDYLIHKVGKPAVEGTKKRDPNAAKDAAKKLTADFKAFGKKYLNKKLDRNGFYFIVRRLMKLVKKDGSELTKRGKDFLKVAGLSVGDSE